MSTKQTQMLPVGLHAIPSHATYLHMLPRKSVTVAQVETLVVRLGNTFGFCGFLLCFLSCWKKLGLVPMVPVFSKLLQGSRLLSCHSACHGFQDLISKVWSSALSTTRSSRFMNLASHEQLLASPSEWSPIQWNVHPEQDGFHIVSTLFPPCPAFKTSLSRCSRSRARPLSQACSCFNVGWGPGGKDHGWSIAQHGPAMLSIFFRIAAVSTLFSQTHYIQLLY